MIKKAVRDRYIILGIKLCKWTRTKLIIDRMEDTLNHIDRSVEILMWDRSEALIGKSRSRSWYNDGREKASS